MNRYTATSMLLLFSLICVPASAEHRALETGAFAVEHSVVLPGTPEVIYDAITGDISGWWDHSFSKEPLRFYIEPRPGGGFFEIFDEAGNGVLHATVIAAVRGKLLRFEGPLGFSGHAITMVTTWEFEPAGTDSTRLDVKVHCSGEIEEQWVAAVDGVWKHFIVDRFSEYVTAGRHLGR